MSVELITSMNVVSFYMSAEMVRGLTLIDSGDEA